MIMSKVGQLCGFGIFKMNNEYPGKTNPYLEMETGINNLAMNSTIRDVN